MRFSYFIIILFFLSPTLFAQEKSNLPVRHVLSFHGEDREYYIQPPLESDPGKAYWLLIVVHGGGGNGRSYWLSDGIMEAMKEKKRPINAVIVTPSFSNSDVQASRFPQLGEGEFLMKVIKELKSKYALHEKILLTGYSRGGQFSHRFALQHPELVKACAPFSAGTWTTPHGTLLIESMDAISDPVSFLNDTSNMSLVPERLHGMFESRVVQVAGLQASSASKKVPFLIMSGTLDPRWDIAQQFASSLMANGYQVQTSWPETPHTGRKEYPEEFRKYATNAVSFFLEALAK